VAFTWKRSRVQTGLAADALGSLDRGWTGALVIDSGHSTARIFLYEGDVYAVELGGFHPDVLARLVSAGRLAPTGSARESASGSSHQDVLLAVESGECTPEEIAVVHSEFMLAGLGAILAADQQQTLTIETDEGATTAQGCALPIALASAKEAVNQRGSRMAADARYLIDRFVVLPKRNAEGVDPFAWTGDVQWTAPTIDEASGPELRALAGALDGRSIDAAAGRCGFTRAEALHLTAVLAARNEVSATEVMVTPHGCAVPEAWPGCS